MINCKENKKELKEFLVDSDGCGTIELRKKKLYWNFHKQIYGAYLIFFLYFLCIFLRQSFETLQMTVFDQSYYKLCITKIMN